MTRRSSQAYWTEAEALERAGRTREALDLFVRAASVEESNRPLHARHLWEQIAEKFGTSPSLFERLASSSEKGELIDDAFFYWLAAAVEHHKADRAQDSEYARERASVLKPRRSPDAKAPELAAKSLDPSNPVVASVLEEAPSEG